MVGKGYEGMGREYERVVKGLEGEKEVLKKGVGKERVMGRYGGGVGGRKDVGGFMKWF